MKKKQIDPRAIQDCARKLLKALKKEPSDYVAGFYFCVRDLDAKETIAHFSVGEMKDTKVDSAKDLVLDMSTKLGQQALETGRFIPVPVTDNFSSQLPRARLVACGDKRLIIVCDGSLEYYNERMVQALALAMGSQLVLPDDDKTSLAIAQELLRKRKEGFMYQMTF